MSRDVINLTIDKEDPSADCHLMPCKIDDKNTQELRAREYFRPTIRCLAPIEDDNDEIKELKRPPNYVNSPDDPLLLASFRGRPLQGKKVKIPDEFCGYAMSKRGQQSTTTKPPMHKYFEEFTYWNWDELPSKDNATVKAFGWLNVAKAIHDPIIE